MLSFFFCEQADFQFFKKEIELCIYYQSISTEMLMSYNLKVYLKMSVKYPDQYNIDTIIFTKVLKKLEMYYIFYGLINLTKFVFYCVNVKGP